MSGAAHAQGCCCGGCRACDPSDCGDVDTLGPVRYVAVVTGVTTCNGTNYNGIYTVVFAGSCTWVFVSSDLSLWLTFTFAAGMGTLYGQCYDGSRFTYWFASVVAVSLCDEITFENDNGADCSFFSGGYPVAGFGGSIVLYPCEVP